MSQTIYKDEVHQGYVDLNKNELRNPRLQQLAADIASPVDGLFFYRTDTHKVRVRANGVWVDLATMADVTAGGISQSIFDAKGDLIAASAADTAVREAVGANGTFYVADSTQATGHIWRTIADGDIPAAIARDSEVTTAVTNHEGAADPHTGYQRESEKGAANGYASLDAGTKVPVAQISEVLATGDLSDWPRTAALDLNSQKITGLADGTATTDAATFGQLNAVLEGRSWKEPVDAATTASITLSGTQTIDGVAALAVCSGSGCRMAEE